MCASVLRTQFVWESSHFAPFFDIEHLLYTQNCRRDAILRYKKVIVGKNKQLRQYTIKAKLSPYAMQAPRGRGYIAPTHPYLGTRQG
jgi:hypothetical protein